MNYSITGLAYLSLLVSLGYVIYRFFLYWKREKDIIAKHSLGFTVPFWLFVLMSTISGLFFASNSDVLEQTRKIGAFIQAFAFAIMAYHIIYIQFPGVSPWLGFVPIFILGLIVAIFNLFFISFNPVLEPSGAINWGYSFGTLDIAVSLLRLFLFFITFLPLIVILFSQFKNSPDSRVKGKALGMGLALLFVLIAASFDFLFISVFGLNPIWRDIAFIITSIVLLIALILTLPRSLSKYE